MYGQSKKPSGKVFYEIQNERIAQKPFHSNEILKLAPSNSNRIKDIPNATYFYFDLQRSKKEVVYQAPLISMSLPHAMEENGTRKNEILNLLLRKVEIHSPDFSSNHVYKPGIHYRGIVEGNENSLVSISIFDSEIIGLIHHNGKTLTLGKVKGKDSMHILYDEKTSGIGDIFSCDSTDDGIPYTPEQLLPPPTDNRSPGDCIKEEVNIHQTLTNQVGGTSQASNYATGLFNNHQALCANDGFTVSLSRLNVWSNSNPAPWSTNEYNTLDNWQNATGAIDGDLAYCAFYESGFGGGVAASIGGLCSSNPDGSKSVGGHNGSVSNVPTYSQDVFLMSHEMGHLFGARHTHACVWNGNGSAIDGCSGFTEGGCSVPPSANPGTIMSYCAPNVDFNEGFHPQVKNAILNHIAGSSCTSPCGDDPTCTDGIQNGQETGLDCGGPDCDPCTTDPTCSDGIQNGQETGIDCGGPDCDPCTTNPTCSDGIQNGQETGIDCGGPDCHPCNQSCTNVTISITLDNYPGETSWELLDSSGIVVASGGTYQNEPNGSTVNAVSCLEDGCYTFSIKDSYGDGICCRYGSGSYSVTDEDGTILASGGDFGSVENTNFCIESGGSSCDDVAVRIEFDNYPEETSWDITDNEGTVVAYGGTYENQADGSTIEVINCLDVGCYTFSIKDSYGDGICCNYGLGSYALIDENGNALASGGNFGYIESTNFCIESSLQYQNLSLNNDDVTLFPNPTTNIMTVKGMEVANASIFTLLGKHIPVSVENNVIDTSILSAGVYLIQLKDDKGEILIKKIIKE